MKKHSKPQSAYFGGRNFLVSVLLLGIAVLAGCTSASPPETGTDAVDGGSVTATIQSDEATDVLTESLTEDTTEEPTEETTSLPEPPVTEVTYTWRNPIRYKNSTPALRDPFILKVGDLWYMTGTLPPYGLSDEAGRTKGVPLYKSADMTTWEFVDYIVQTPAEAEGKWYSERFWAAELFAHNGKYYVTVNCCRVDGSNHGFLFAVADNIEGPYTVMNPDAPLALGNDAHLFVDTDGQTYVFASNIMYAKIDLDTLTLLTAWQYPVTPIKGSDAWNGERPGVGFEGPYVLTAGGKYYMFYSTWARGYEVGLTSADSINGEWFMYPDPMYGGMSQGFCDSYGSTYEEGYYENQDRYSECGHNSVFEGPDGELWIAAHAYLKSGSAGPYLIIDRLVFDEERGILTLDTKTGQTINGPTYGTKSVTYDSTNNEATPLHALDVWKYVDVNQPCDLPDEVDLLLENGFRRCIPVIWNGVPDTSKAGKSTVSGKATYKGVEYSVTAHVSVRETSSASCDFQDVEVGSTSFGDAFNAAFGIKFQSYESIGRGPAVIAEQDDNRFIRCTAYMLAELSLPMTDAYTVSLDWRCLDAQTAGGIAERLGGIVLHGGDQTRFPHYEEENKIASKCIGASGLLILPAEDGFRIVVKTFDENANTVTHSETFIRYSNGLDFTTIKITEAEGTITAYAEDTLIFTAELADEGTYNNASHEYYRSVTVKDADGATLLRISNAFLTVKPTFHIVSRGWTAFDLDNIYVKME